MLDARSLHQPATTRQEIPDLAAGLHAPGTDRIATVLASSKPLELSDREIFRNHLEKFPQWTSELTFANLFAWAPIQYPRWSEIDGHLLVSYDPGNTGHDRRFLPPIGPHPAELMTRLAREHGFVFVRVDRDIASQLPPGMTVEATPADHDYLYHAKQVLALEGSQASELRRRLGKLMRNHGTALSTRPLDNSSIGDAQVVVDRWLESRLASSTDDADRAAKREDAVACMRILERWEQFPELRGTISYHNGVPCSLCIGEMVEHPKAPQGLFISHFEKSAISRELEGLPTYAFQQIVRPLDPQCVVNRMQTTGNPGLEVWKKSWGPFGLAEKVMVSLSQ